MSYCNFIEKYNVLTKINTFLLIFILLLLFVNRYYELFSDHISVLLLCTYLSYLVIALTIVKLIKYQKGALSKIEIFGLLIIAVIISFVGRDMFSDWKNHIIYSSDDISVIARVNRTMFGNRCDICICSNGAVMKKVDEPLALQSDYDPFLTATEQKGIEKLYKKLTGKDMLTNLSVSADMHITIDREHKKMDYTSYLWFDGNTLMETPILCKNDKVEIGTTNILGNRFKPLLELDITGSSYAS